ncbi:hypothetical protein AQPE_1292 [Aquipluma nitroreducens]|uniref:Abortive infection protein n=1 Tax=Aquipluma nitroreducens TaxID=2010828 RepID=A0A5K7S6H7_9BACT|nr:hypothetical protein [Aquipluma nitroreducens]BBE17143.1 hypothetical protein AQPE_1292 [Aquipluma nitroreducens]
MTKDVKSNLITYLFFLFIAGLGIYWGNAYVSDFKYIRIWDYTNILFLLIGVPFLLLQSKAKLPDFWQLEISNKNRFLFPIAIGLLFGILDILIFKVILHPQPYPELPPFTQPFPYSIFLYFSGAFEVEVFYRLIPLTIILLFASWFRKGKNYMVIFWIGALLTAVREPIEQIPQGGFLLVTYAIITGLLMNFLQAIWYKKAGFLASLSIRLGHYLIWHILLGIYIEHWEILK